MRRYLERISLSGVLLLSACSSLPEQGARAPSAREMAAGQRETAPADAQQRYAAALQALQDGRNGEARVLLQALAQDYPRFSGPLTELGILQARGRDRAAAIASFGEAVRRNPRNIVAWNWLGSLQRESGQYAAAEQAYRQAMAVQPQDPAAYLNLAILYDVSLHRSHEALQAYRDYQRLAGSAAKPIVAAWIKELEGGREHALALALPAETLR